MLWTDAGKNFLSVIMLPVTALGQPTFELVLPYFLKSPYEMGIR
jgi:hypothetical protein